MTRSDWRGPSSSSTTRSVPRRLDLGGGSAAAVVVVLADMFNSRRGPGCGCGLKVIDARWHRSGLAPGLKRKSKSEVGPRHIALARRAADWFIIRAGCAYGGIGRHATLRW